MYRIKKYLYLSINLFQFLYICYKFFSKIFLQIAISKTLFDILYSKFYHHK